MKATTHSQRTESARERRGAVAPFLALMAVPLMGLIAFSIDYGFLKNVEAELQRAADASALAAVMDLIPAADGTQDAAAVRATVKAYVQENLTSSPAGDNTFTVLDADIEIGSYDETTINGTGPVTLNSTGVWDTVRVTLRRDATANGEVGLFFAKVLGQDAAPVVVSATAVLRRGTGFKPGADILPFSVPYNWVDAMAPGTQFSIYNDNKIYDADGNEVMVQDSSGNWVSGNWGTVDIGHESNSTHDLDDQIINGLTQANLDDLYTDGRIPTATELAAPVDFQADTGISIGIKDEVQAIHGQTRIIPLYESINGDLLANGGGGNTAEFNIAGWSVIHVVNSNWVGNKETSVEVLKAYMYDEALIPQQDLTNKNTTIENAFTSPVLVR